MVSQKPIRVNIAINKSLSWHQWLIAFPFRLYYKDEKSGKLLIKERFRFHWEDIYDHLDKDHPDSRIVNRNNYRR